MFRKNKLSTYLIASFLFHIIMILAMSKIYADQPPKHRRFEIVSAVRIQYKETKPPPKPEVVNVVQPTEREESKNVLPRKKKEIVPKKVEPSVTAPGPSPAWETALQVSKEKPSKGAEGVAGFKGAYGSAGDRPSMSTSSGVSHPTLTTKAGGSGLASDRAHGSMELPTGSSFLPGAGGKEIAGFQVGASRTGGGIGKADIRGGSRGSGGKGEEGPGQGLATGTDARGSGTGTTGLGVGKSGGMGEIGPGGSEESGSGGKAGSGAGGPGTGGYDATGSRSGPSLTVKSGTDGKGSKEAPTKRELSEEKRTGATGKSGFKADLGKGMTGVTTQAPIDKSDVRGFGDALQNEINRDLHSLRKMYEDWQNLKIPDTPKALQITIELNMEKGAPKILSINFHNTALASRIKDDLTKKIREWKFKSLYDGKDDPKKWPVKLSGRISWQ